MLMCKETGNQQTQQNKTKIRAGTQVHKITGTPRQKVWAKQGQQVAVFLKLECLEVTCFGHYGQIFVFQPAAASSCLKCSGNTLYA